MRLDRGLGVGLCGEGPDREVAVGDHRNGAAYEPSVMTTDPTEWSRISLATARTLSDRLAVTTFAVIINRSCTA